MGLRSLSAIHALCGMAEPSSVRNVIGWTAPYLRAAQGARHDQPAPEGAVHLNFNESPYGPSPKGIEALASCGNIASRYPDSLYFRMRDALAQIHGVQRDNIMLGCGSTEILCVADEAFLSPGKNLVVADTTFEAVVEYVQAAHGEVVKVRMTPDHRHDLAALPFHEADDVWQ